MNDQEWAFYKNTVGFIWAQKYEGIYVRLCAIAFISIFWDEIFGRWRRGNPEQKVPLVLLQGGKG